MGGCQGSFSDRRDCLSILGTGGFLDVSRHKHVFVSWKGRVEFRAGILPAPSRNNGL